MGNSSSFRRYNAVTVGTATAVARPILMLHSSVTLSKSAKLCREMAADCVTDEARKALLDAADSLDGGARQEVQVPRSDRPLFHWTR